MPEPLPRQPPGELPGRRGAAPALSRASPPLAALLPGAAARVFGGQMSALLPPDGLPVRGYPPAEPVPHHGDGDGRRALLLPPGPPRAPLRVVRCPSVPRARPAPPAELVPALRGPHSATSRGAAETSPRGGSPGGPQAPSRSSARTPRRTRTSPTHLPRPCGELTAPLPLPSPSPCPTGTPASTSRASPSPSSSSRAATSCTATSSRRTSSSTRTDTSRLRTSGARTCGQGGAGAREAVSWLVVSAGPEARREEKAHAASVSAAAALAPTAAS